MGWRLPVRSTAEGRGRCAPEVAVIANGLASRDRRMNIKLQLPKLTHLRPRITVVGVGGAGSNAVNNMITSGLTGVNFVVANTDAQSLANSAAEHRIQLGASLTEGLGAGAQPEIGRRSAEDSIEDIRAQVAGSHMVFVAAGMGGGTGTGAAAVIARIARECGALTVGVVTKPFHFEGTRRMRAAEAGIVMLRPEVDTLIVIPNQNLFRVANERTTFADAFVEADQVLYSGIACIVDLIVKEGLINLDFADVRTVMSGMGTAMMGTGEAAGDKRAVIAAEEAISNPLLDDISLRGAKGLLVSITGSRDLKLYEVDEAATRVRQEVDGEANIIVGATFDDSLGDKIRVSIVASGMERLDSMTHSWEQAAERRSYARELLPPSQADLQPPFIEPYPEPYSVPAHQVAASAEAGTAPPDFARALSEALEQGAGDGGPSHHEHQHSGSWASQDGAMFEEAPPPISPDPLAPHGQTQPGRAPAADASFHPTSPADTRHLGRRMPELEEFPLVGQREHRAKSTKYSEPAPPHAQQVPRAYSQPAPKPEPKPGLLARLLGARRKANVAKPATADYPQAADESHSNREAAGHGARSRAAPSARPASRRDAERDELPAIFSAERK